MRPASAHRVTKIPVLYVFVDEPVDVDDCRAKVSALFDSACPLLLLYSVEYAYCAGMYELQVAFPYFYCFAVAFSLMSFRLLN